MIQFVLGIASLALTGLIVFWVSAFVFSFLPDWSQHVFGLGCGCLVALVALLIVSFPILMLILWILGECGV